jgi:hypothetical protein
MIISAAIVFGAVAVLGAAIGLGHVWHPISGQSVESYGWGLFINALAIAAFFAWRAALAPSSPKIKPRPQPAQFTGHAQPECARAESEEAAAPQTTMGRGPRLVGSPIPRTPHATVVLPDDPEAILDALVERVGTAGVELMLRNRARVAEAAA